MWPKHDNGDIAAYHEAQKRFGAYANVQANADYEQGEGYRQIQPQQAELFDINGLRRNANTNGVGFEAFEYNWGIFFLLMTTYLFADDANDNESYLIS